MAYWRFDTLSDDDSEGLELEFGDCCMKQRSNSDRTSADDVRTGQILIKDEDFRMAIRGNNLDEVKRILKEGFHVDQVLMGGWTPLMHACDYGHDGIVNVLLSEGANPNTQIDTFSPLMTVCCSRYTDGRNLLNCAIHLLNSGALVYVHDRHNMYPLMYACQHGHFKLVELLLSKHADMNQQDIRGWTPLMFAASNGNLEVVKILIETGADISVMNNSGETAVILAESGSYGSVVNFLMSSLNRKDDAVTCTLPAYLSPVEQDIKSSHGSRLLMAREEAITTKIEESVQHGDLEVFLLGLQLGDHLQIFQKHHITFSTLLCMTEEDLKQVGITQVGIRKKILQAIMNIHKKEWTMPDHSKSVCDGLSSSEAIVVLSHLTKHIKYITGTTSFLLMHTRRNKDLLDPRMEANQSKRLIDAAKCASKAVNSLQEDLQHLENDVICSLGASSTSLQRNTFFKSQKKYLKIFLSSLVIGGLSGFGLIIWYKHK